MRKIIQRILDQVLDPQSNPPALSQTVQGQQGNSVQGAEDLSNVPSDVDMGMDLGLLGQEMDDTGFLDWLSGINWNTEDYPSDLGNV